jgi:hypothetical protein
MPKDITLVIVDTINHGLAKFSIDKTLENIDCKEVLVFSDQHLFDGAKHVLIKQDINLYDYSEIILKQLGPHINSNHVVVIQWDGMAVNQHLWTDDFLKYDYIGAIWPWAQNGIHMGNGGFSLRSRKLIDACGDNDIKLGGFSGQNEDIAICVEYSRLLQEKYAIQYAPIQIARQFSTENEWLGPTLGFHGIWNSPRFLDQTEVNYIIEHIPNYYWKDASKVSALIKTLAEYGLKSSIELCVEKYKKE